jgi:hypothetical protein
LIINDIAEVLYAPVKAFKRIIENPKYLGALIILLLFIGVSLGYEYAQFAKTYTENTSPEIGKLSMYTNATYWNAPNRVVLTNNYFDFYNYSVYVATLGYLPTDSNGYYNIFNNYTNDVGPSCLQIDATNANSISANISNVFNVDCSETGFQNLSMTIKQVAPQTAPQSAEITLYSLSDSSFYTFNLTPFLSNTSTIGSWQNLIVPIGPSAQGWTNSGTPNWLNVTALKLGFTYPTSSNITIHLGSLFFHGQYQTPIQYNSTGLLFQFLQLFGLQFILGWFILTGVIYLFFKGLKTNVTWKPLLVALAFALFVMVIRSLVCVVATLALPQVYFPFDISLGVRFDTYGTLYFPSDSVSYLSAQSQAAASNIASLSSGFRDIVSGMFVVAYVWLGALCTVIIGTLKPEFSMAKRIVISAVSVAVTILLLLLLVGVV